LFVVAYFSTAAFVNWKGLHKAPEHSSFVELFSSYSWWQCSLSG
jgi:hypothetical protein